MATPFVDPHDDDTKHIIRPATILAALTLWIILALAAIGAWGVATAIARPAEVQPIAIPTPLAKARAACPVDATRTCYLTALRHAYEAIAWSHKQRAHDQHTQHGYGVQHALRLASALYGIPITQLERVGQCESHLHPESKNRASTASGLFQFLSSTWNRAGIPGFSPFDPYANAIAAARLVALDGSWREWSCRWAA